MKITSGEVIAAQTTESVQDQPEPGITAIQIEDAMQLAEWRPEAAILEGFRNVELVLLNTARSVDISVDSIGVSQAVQLLNERQVLNSELVRIFCELWGLRNQVAHSSAYKISSQQAVDYVAQCNIFISAVQ